jgi:hypothetical protein
MATLSPDQRNYYYLVEQIPSYHTGFVNHRDSLLEGVCIGRGLDTKEAAIASLVPDDKVTAASEDETVLAVPLKQFVQQLSANYRGYPKASEALVRMIQLMVNLVTQLDRELLTFVRRLPGEYQERDYQRDALIRLVQLWHELPTRNQAISSLMEDQKCLNQARYHTKEAPPKPLPLYWALDPWWPGGLDRFINFPNLCHIDARSYWARWLN